MTPFDPLGAFALGLAGAAHCLGMCGGIASALSVSSENRLSPIIAYHVGRLGSYTLLGGFLGLLTGSIEYGAWTLALRYLAALLLIAMGLYIADWWRGLVLLERGGAIIWRPVQKLGSRWLPVTHWRQGFALGMCWGLLPCGLIYSSLAWAATAQSPLVSAGLMLMFGLGTLPAMLATSLGARQLQGWLRRRGLQVTLGLLLVLAGLFSLYTTASHSSHLDSATGHAESATSHQNH